MFDPNKSAEAEWATFVPTRSPRFKIHVNRGHAINAVKCTSYWDHDHLRTIPDDVILYRRVEGRWVQVDVKRTYNDEDQSIL